MEAQRYDGPCTQFAEKMANGPLSNILEYLGHNTQLTTTKTDKRPTLNTPFSMKPLQHTTHLSLFHEGKEPRAPCPKTGQLLAEKCGSTGQRVWTSPCYRTARTTEHMLQT